MNAEIKRWDDNGLKWDLSDAEQRFRAMLRDADDAKRKCFIPVLLSKDVASPLSEPEIIKAQRAFLGALPALDWDRLAFEAVHFVLDAHASVQAARQRGSDADSVKALQIAVSLLCRYEALLPIEYIVAALGTRDLTDSFANQVLQAILVGDDRTTFRDSRVRISRVSSSCSCCSHSVSLCVEKNKSCYSLLKKLMLRLPHLLVQAMMVWQRVVMQNHHTHGGITQIMRFA